MGKSKIKTSASEGAARFTDESEAGPVERGPGYNGNDFDIDMSQEADGVAAARKIVEILKARGVCVVQANAPHDLLVAAHDEAVDLLDDNEFSAPLRVHDDSSMMEAKVYNAAWGDEHKVHWIRESAPAGRHLKNALKLLSRNIADFGAGLGDFMSRSMGITYDRHGHTMLSCYTGDRQYSLHIDNPHACDPDRHIPDCGMRLSASYFINPHWDPNSGDNGGGLDIHLTDPMTSPASSSSARAARRIRVAPHADTLVLYLSERMAHQVIQTKGSTKWFCLNMWFMDGKAMDELPKKIQELQRMRRDAGDDSDDDLPD